MQKQELYVIPELKLVGDTSEVVLGSMGIGFDVMGEHLSGGREFDTDDGPPVSAR
jgi:hypothetical protein